MICKGCDSVFHDSITSMSKRAREPDFYENILRNYSYYDNSDSDDLGNRLEGQPFVYASDEPRGLDAPSSTSTPSSSGIPSIPLR